MALPGIDPKRGDIYKVAAVVVLEPQPKPQPRPMICVREQPDEWVWRAMGRSASVGDSTEALFSPADESLGLSKDGWWSWRYLMSVKRRWTGTNTDCTYISTMVDPLLSEVMDYYKGAPRDLRVPGK